MECKIEEKKNTLFQKVYILWCSRYKSSTFLKSASKYPNLARTSHTHSSKSHWSHLEDLSAIDTKLQSVIVPCPSDFLMNSSLFQIVKLESTCSLKRGQLDALV